MPERRPITLSGSGQVAQLVEQRTENPRVGGSIPSLAIEVARADGKYGAIVRADTASSRLSVNGTSDILILLGTGPVSTSFLACSRSKLLHRIRDEPRKVGLHILIARGYEAILNIATN